MNRIYLLLIALIAVFFACNKELVTNKDIEVNSFVHAKALVGKEKEAMLSSVSKDALFQDYLAALADIQKTHDEQLSKAQKYDVTKWKSAEKPKTEADFVAFYKNLGYSDPELILIKYKEAKDKLAKL